MIRWSENVNEIYEPSAIWQRGVITISDYFKWCFTFIFFTGASKLVADLLHKYKRLSWQILDMIVLKRVEKKGTFELEE